MALHFAHYNFCRIHKSLRITPAMAAGNVNNVWKADEVISYLLSLRPFFLEPLQIDKRFLRFCTPQWNEILHPLILSQDYTVEIFFKNTLVCVFVINRNCNNLIKI